MKLSSFGDRNSHISKKFFFLKKRSQQLISYFRCTIIHYIKEIY
nr:MAG TPA: hypothetical protein [Myoviridae sp. ctTS62]